MYGSAEGGGIYGVGSIFELSPVGTYTTIYSYQNSPTPRFGTPINTAQPYNILRGSDGNFYGTISVDDQAHANYGGGLVYEVTAVGTESTLYNFPEFLLKVNYPNPVTSKNQYGSEPLAPLTQGSDGAFYGTTCLGGVHGGGVIYRIIPTGAYTLLHQFGGGGKNSDGACPAAALTQGSDGNFYGATLNGGENQEGTLFKIGPDGSAFTVLHTLGADVTGDINSDGMKITAPLIQASNGSFYGVAPLGGSNGSGTVFSITADGTFTLLHVFDKTDGSEPSRLVVTSSGSLYGDTSYGGTNDTGTLFKISATGTFTSLYSFGAYTGTGYDAYGGVNGDGAQPYALVLSATGVLYGETFTGGSAGAGVLFSVSVGN